MLRNTLDNTRFKRSSVEYAAVSELLGADLGRRVHAFAAYRCGRVFEPELIHRLLPDEVRGEVKVADLETALADSLYSGYIEKQKLATERVNHHDASESAGKFSVQYGQRSFE